MACPNNHNDLESNKVVSLWLPDPVAAVAGVLGVPAAAAGVLGG